VCSNTFQTWDFIFGYLTVFFKTYSFCFNVSQNKSQCRIKIYIIYYIYRNFIRTRFLVTVIDLRDGLPPAAMTELLSADAPSLCVVAGDYVQITSAHLGVMSGSSQPHPGHVGDSVVSFHVRSIPTHGRILYLHHPLSVGRSVSSFSHSEVNNGKIWYKQDAVNKMKSDEDYRIVLNVREHGKHEAIVEDTESTDKISIRFVISSRFLV